MAEEENRPVEEGVEDTVNADVPASEEHRDKSNDGSDERKKKKKKKSRHEGEEGEQADDDDVEKKRKKKKKKDKSKEGEDEDAGAEGEEGEGKKKKKKKHRKKDKERGDQDGEGDEDEVDREEKKEKKKKKKKKDHDDEKDGIDENAEEDSKSQKKSRRESKRLDQEKDKQNVPEPTESPPHESEDEVSSEKEIGNGKNDPGEVESTQGSGPSSAAVSRTQSRRGSLIRRGSKSEVSVSGGDNKSADDAPQIPPPVAEGNDETKDLSDPSENSAAPDVGEEPVGDADEDRGDRDNRGRIFRRLSTRGQSSSTLPSQSQSTEGPRGALRLWDRVRVSRIGARDPKSKRHVLRNTVVGLIDMLRRRREHLYQQSMMGGEELVRSSSGEPMEGEVDYEAVRRLREAGVLMVEGEDNSAFVPGQSLLEDELAFLKELEESKKAQQASSSDSDSETDWEKMTEAQRSKAARAMEKVRMKAEGGMDEWILDMLEDDEEDLEEAAAEAKRKEFEHYSYEWSHMKAEDHRSNQIPLVTKDGLAELCRRDTNIQPVRDDEGNVIAVIDLAGNIVMTPQSLQELAATNDTLTPIVDEHGRTIAVVDENGDIVATSQPVAVPPTPREGEEQTGVQFETSEPITLGNLLQVSQDLKENAEDNPELAGMSSLGADLSAFGIEESMSDGETETEIEVEEEVTDEEAEDIVEMVEQTYVDENGEEQTEMVEKRRKPKKTVTTKKTVMKKKKKTAKSMLAKQGFFLKDDYDKAVAEHQAYADSQKPKNVKRDSETQYEEGDTGVTNRQKMANLSKALEVDDRLDAVIKQALDLALGRGEYSRWMPEWDVMSPEPVGRKKGKKKKGKRHSISPGKGWDSDTEMFGLRPSEKHVRFWTEDLAKTYFNTADMAKKKHFKFKTLWEQEEKLRAKELEEEEKREAAENNDGGNNDDAGDGAGQSKSNPETTQVEGAGPLVQSEGDNGQQQQQEEAAEVGEQVVATNTEDLEANAQPPEATETANTLGGARGNGEQPPPSSGPAETGTGVTCTVAADASAEPGNEGEEGKEGTQPEEELAPAPPVGLDGEGKERLQLELEKEAEKRRKEEEHFKLILRQALMKEEFVGEISVDADDGEVIVGFLDDLLDPDQVPEDQKPDPESSYLPTPEEAYWIAKAKHWSGDFHPDLLPPAEFAPPPPQSEEDSPSKPPSPEPRTFDWRSSDGNDSSGGEALKEAQTKRKSGPKKLKKKKKGSGSPPKRRVASTPTADDSEPEVPKKRTSSPSNKSRAGLTSKQLSAKSVSHSIHAAREVPVDVASSFSRTYDLTTSDSDWNSEEEKLGTTVSRRTKRKLRQMKKRKSKKDMLKMADNIVAADRELDVIIEAESILGHEYTKSLSKIGLTSPLEPRAGSAKSSRSNRSSRSAGSTRSKKSGGDTSSQPDDVSSADEGRFGQSLDALFGDRSLTAISNDSLPSKLRLNSRVTPDEYAHRSSLLADSRKDIPRLGDEDVDVNESSLDIVEAERMVDESLATEFVSREKDVRFDVETSQSGVVAEEPPTQAKAKKVRRGKSPSAKGGSPTSSTSPIRSRHLYRGSSQTRKSVSPPARGNSAASNRPSSRARSSSKESSKSVLPPLSNASPTKAPEPSTAQALSDEVVKLPSTTPTFKPKRRPTSSGRAMDPSNVKAGDLSDFSLRPASAPTNEFKSLGHTKRKLPSTGKTTGKKSHKSRPKSHTTKTHESLGGAVVRVGPRPRTAAAPRLKDPHDVVQEQMDRYWTESTMRPPTPIDRLSAPSTSMQSDISFASEAWSSEHPMQLASGVDKTVAHYYQDDGIVHDGMRIPVLYDPTSDNEDDIQHLRTLTPTATLKVS